MKILTIIGARPQFVKAAAVSHTVSTTLGLAEILVHTGQHYDAAMSEVFFEELGIPHPAYHLGIGGLSHGAMTGRQLEKIEEVLLQEKPDWVLVYGDTNSTLAGALAAIKLQIPVAHVEAGLRSFNRRMPEEHNRVLTDHSADLLLAPTPTAVENLIREGLSSSQIHHVGDVMFDAVKLFRPIAEAQSKVLSSLPSQNTSFILATIHRAETTDNLAVLQRIIRALQLSPLPVVLPLHPRTRKVTPADWWEHRNLIILDPVGYLDMLVLEQNAALIVTDSGGVQKEAFFQGTPCVTLRTETEWTELIEAGWNRLAPLHSVEAIQATIETAMGSRGITLDVYGDGHGAQKILQQLCLN